MEWQTNETVLRWQEEQSRSRFVDNGAGATHGHSIESEVDVCSVHGLPWTVQDQLNAKFEEERQYLRGTINALEAELESSKQAFDRYRERARTSLTKAGAEQQRTSLQLAQVEEQLNRQIVLTKEAQLEVKSASQRCNTDTAALRASLENERNATALINKQINSIKDELLLLSEQEKCRIAEHEIYERRTANEVKTAKDELLAVQSEYQSVLAREKRLVADQRKKSETARQMCLSKDKEMAKLLETISNLKQSLVTNTNSSGSGSSTCRDKVCSGAVLTSPEVVSTLAVESLAVTTPGTYYSVFGTPMVSDPSVAEENVPAVPEENSLQSSVSLNLRDELAAENTSNTGAQFLQYFLFYYALCCTALQFLF